MFAIPINLEPGKALENKTGSWRVEVKPKFLQKNCTACRRCWLICPEGCIEGKEKNTYHPDYNYCKGCGLCAEVCPVNDIVLIPEGESL